MTMKHTVLLLALALPLAAQDAAHTQQQLQEQRERYELQQQVDNLRGAKTERPALKTEEAESDDAPATAEEKQPVLPLKKLSFDKSRILPPPLLRDLRRRYEGRTLSLADIKAITKTINKVYEEKGYLTSRAYLDEQDVSGGHLHISLMEGTIGKMSTKGLRYTKEGYVTRSFRMREGELFRVEDIEQQLTAFNAVSDLKARLNISPGNAAGSTDLELVMQEAARCSAVFFTDNSGQRGTGYYRGGVFGTLHGLCNTAYTRDRLTLGYVGSEGANSFSAGYQLTENTFRTTWSVNLDRSETEIITKELSALEVEGDYTALNLGVKRPMVSTGSHVLSAGLNLLLKENENRLSGATTGHFRSNVFSATIDDLWVGEKGYLFNALTLHHGRPLTAGQRPFLRLSYRAEGQLTLNRFLSLTERANAQLANRRELQSSEQIQLGGINSVRGYEESMLNGERGISCQTELHLNLLPLFSSTPAAVKNAELFGFFDCGQLRHHAADTTLRRYNESFLSSAGGGIRLGLTDHLSMSATLALPLRKHDLNYRANKPHYLYAVNAAF